jgi:glycosyltransferase 2 family protein
MAVKKVVVTIVKLALVAGLMWYVFRQVPFQDRIVYRRGEQEVGQTDIHILGSWKAEPVRYTIGDDPKEQTVARGEQPDGRTAEVEPGFLTYWSDLDPLLFALGALCYFITALVAGARWWWLLRVNGTDVSLGEALRFTGIGIFFNQVFPSATGGDVVKAIYIMKRCPGHRVEVLVSVIVDRVLGLASLAMLGAVVVLFALDRFAMLAAGVWGVIGLVGLLGVVALSKRLRQFVRLKWLLDRLPARIGGKLKLVDQAVFFYRDHKMVIAASVVVGMANHCLSVLSVVLIGEAIGIGMPTLEYFVLIPIINIALVLPVSPSGWGYGEAMYKYFFGTYGAPHLAGVPAAVAIETMGNRGVALSVLYKLHVICWSLLGGLLVLFEKDRVTKADIEREVEQEEREDDVEPPRPHG